MTESLHRVNVLGREKRRVILKGKKKSLSFPAADFESWYERMGIHPLKVSCPCGAGVLIDIPFYSESSGVMGLMGVACEECGLDPPEIVIPLR